MNAWLEAAEAAPTAPAPAAPAAGLTTTGHTVPGRAPRLWVVGTHGGAGETTLAAITGARPGVRAWPLLALQHPVPRVLLVARTHLAGLQAAQRAAAQWARGDVPPVELLGLVLNPDAPGRTPRPLRDLAGVIAGGVPQVWHLPWVEEWRVGEQPARQPRPITQLLEDLQALTTPREDTP